MIQPKNVILLVLLFFFGSYSSFAQNIDVELDWNLNEEVEINPDVTGFQLLTPFWCSECKEAINDNFIVPYIDKKIPINAMEVANVQLLNIVTKNSSNRDLTPYLSDDFIIKQEVTIENGRKFLHLLITPVRKSNNGVELLVSCDIQYTSKENYTPGTLRGRNKKDQTYNSILSTGDFYKISISKDGVYRIDPSFLAQMGIDINTVSMSKFKVFGNGGTMLPEVILDPRPEDLVENAIMAFDENGNDKLDANDYFLWYAKGPDAFTFNINNQKYDAASHDFDEYSYYFITFDGLNGKRITSNSSGQGQAVDHIINTYDHILFHENDEENHIKSGRIWWGDKMQTQLVKTFNYSIPGLVTNAPSRFRVITGVRSLNGGSIAVKVAGISTSPINHGSVSGDYDRDFLTGPYTTDRDFTITSENFDIEFEFFKTLNESAAWIDYFMLVSQRKLQVYEDQQIVRINSLNKVGNLKFEIESFSSEDRIWNIADINNPSNQQIYTDGTKSSFILSNINQSNLPQFVVFNNSQIYSPGFVEKVENQNLHGLTNVDYVIISHDDLLEQANRLADFHRSYYGYSVEVVTPKQIFNEFSSGSQDVTGIRDFAKLLYDRGNASGSTFKYLLLFGDASYDYKDIEDNNTNVVPIYQSYNSHQPPYSYCSDDYYAILDDGEGYWGVQNKDEGLDLGVGRLPASNAYEAKIIVDKILHYHSENSYGNWTQNLTFIGDDEDGNDHVGPSESMTQILRNQNPDYNINKIWLDAYEQVSFGSGNKYPAVNEEIS
ncbi:MAG: type IX secretion system sortase PorU, partial [Bacteroidia bacterium]|nr:type IX secretion system sortase PorU [Bacteroidia bacterium]